MKNYEIKSLLYFLFIIILSLFLVTFSSCDIFKDLTDEDPVETSEVGDTLWVHDKISESSLYMGQSLALGQDGSLYYSLNGNQVSWKPSRIVAINKSDGSLKWMSEDLDHIALSSHIMVGDDGTIYAIGYYRLYAINPATGAFKWIWEVPKTLPLPDGGEIGSYGQIGGLALLNNGNMILSTGSSGVYSRALYCVSPTGNMVWYNRDAVAWGIYNNPVVGANNKIFYYEDKHIKSVDGVSGQLLWAKKVGSLSTAANNIVLNDNGELISSFFEEGAPQAHLYRIDPSNGATLWKSVNECKGQGTLLHPNGQAAVFLGSLHLFDLSANTSHKFLPDGSPHTVAINSNNQYIIPSIQSWAHPRCDIYDHDATLDWSFVTSGMRSNIVISNDKVIYYISSSGHVLAIQGDAKLANSAWPKVSHDNRNTFNYSKH